VTITIFLGSLIGAMCLGTPIAFALLVCGVALMWHLDMLNTQILAQNLLEGTNSFPLLAVPFFLLAGELMNAGGLSQRIVRVADALVGHVRGGLGYVALLAAAVVASMSGSAVADSAAVAALLIPMMRKMGYNVPWSAGLIAAGGIIAPVIPPSIALIVYGVAANISITKLFMTGLVPGVLMAVMLGLTWTLCARKEPGARAHGFDARALKQALYEGIWSLVLPVVIIGGMRFGVFTPTEAAVVAVVYSLAVGAFIYKELKWRDLPALLLTAAKTSSAVMFLVAAALVSAWLITVADVPSQARAILEPFMDNKTLLMAVIMLLVLAVGTALDLMPTVLILTPILAPVVQQAGIDPYYFGVMFVMNNAIGLLTPPVGVVLNVVAGVARINLEDVMRGTLPFLASQALLMFLFVLFPEIITIPARWFY
jgi:TRAP transporter, DctM subunit